MALSDQISGVSHLGIATAVLKESVSWYEEKLGFQKVQQKVILAPAMLEVAFLKKGDLMLELCQPSGRAREEIRKRSAGFWDHYAIAAPDLEECVAEAQKKGMVFHSSTPEGITWYENLGEQGVHGANFIGPSGEVVEFCRDDAETSGGRSGLQGWSHLALKVRDLTRTREFYEKLGFRECGGGYLDTPDGRIQILYLENHGFQIEVLQMVGLGLLELERRGAGQIDHLALACPDAGEALWSAKQEKFRLQDFVLQEAQLLDRGVRYFRIIGPDGEKIEINQKI
ncbi:MAG: VOC family protein [Candidatus Limivivens sp.]|nr:VOC family protein [Candidatus Limivivens sp.]